MQIETKRNFEKDPPSPPQKLPSLLKDKLALLHLLHINLLRHKSCTQTFAVYAEPSTL